jgi:hypothetical protein
MKPEEKLAHIEKLIRQRDAITAELILLIGGEGEPKRDDDEVADEEKQEPAPKPPPKGKDTKAAKGCTECGSPSRHKSSCSKAAKKPGAQKVRDVLDGPRLTEEEYDEVCGQIGDGLGIENIAYSYPHVNIAEIRKASKSDDYADYLAS